MGLKEEEVVRLREKTTRGRLDIWSRSIRRERRWRRWDCLLFVEGKMED